MRLIDADKLHERLQALVLDERNKTTYTTWSNAFAEIADMIEYETELDIIRCKDCKFSEEFEGDLWLCRRSKESFRVLATDTCNVAERGEQK